MRFRWCEFSDCDAEAGFLIDGQAYCLLHAQILNAQMDQEDESDD